MKFSYRFVAWFWLFAAAIAVVAASIPPSAWVRNATATATCATTLFAGLAAFPRRGLGRLVVFSASGLFLSILGDYFMSTRGGNESLFLAGIGVFFLAHLAFLAGFLTRRDRRRRFFAFAATSFAVLFVYYLVRIYPNVDGVALRTATLAYLTISIFSLSGAFALDFRPIARTAAFLGVASIVFSDLLIAESVFNGVDRLAFLIIPTYLATHFLLAASVLLEGTNAVSTEKSGDDASNNHW